MNNDGLVGDYYRRRIGVGARKIYTYFRILGS